MSHTKKDDAMNPYYVAYCKDQGNNPTQQKQIDGGKMHNYMCWISSKWSKFSELNKIQRNNRGLHRDEFEEFLNVQN